MVDAWAWKLSLYRGSPPSPVTMTAWVRPWAATSTGAVRQNSAANAAAGTRDDGTVAGRRRRPIKPAPGSDGRPTRHP